MTDPLPITAAIDLATMRAMPGQGRLGDKASVPLDAHGCLACPHPGTGPAVSGSRSVFVNRRPALRIDDTGIHTACCGTNTWRATTGSETVFIDGKAAHRCTDQTTHCGGNGQLVEGSPNVIVGDTSVAPAGQPRNRSPGAAVSPSRIPWVGGAAAPGGDSSTERGDSSAGGAPTPDPGDPGEPGIDLEVVRVQAQVEVLRAAAAAHIPFCEECERGRTERSP